MPAPSGLGRARRALAAIGIAGGLAATFTLGAVAALALHADLAPTRRVVARVLSRVLSRSLLGTIRVGNIDHVGLGGFDGAFVTVLDPEGRQVLAADGLRAGFDLVGIARSAALGTGPIAIDIRQARLEDADVSLDVDGDGRPSLLRAFTPRHAPTPAPTPTAPPSGPAREVHVTIPQIELGRATVHGHLAPFPRMEGEVHGVSASLRTDGGQAVLDLRRFGVSATHLDLRALAGPDADSNVEVQGTAEVHLELPLAAGPKPRGTARFDGWIEGMQASAQASLAADRFDLAADLPHAPPETLRALVPALPVDDVVEAHVRAGGTASRIDVDANLNVGDGAIVIGGPVEIGLAPRASLFVGVVGLDLHAFAPAAPRSSLTAAGSIDLSVDGARFDLKSTSWEAIAGVLLPADSIEVRGRLDRSGVSVEHAFIDVLGVEITVPRKLTVKPGASGWSGPVVEFEAEALVPELDAVPGHVAKGKAHAFASGTFQKGKLDAQVSALLSGVSRGDVKVASGALLGNVSGPLGDLKVNASVALRKLDAGGLLLDAVRATAQGPVTSPRVTLTHEQDATLPGLSVSGTVRRAGDGAAISGLEVAMSKDKLSVSGKAKSIVVGPRGVEVAGIALVTEGVEVGGSARVGAGATEFHLSGKAADLGPLSRALGLSALVTSGRGTFDVSVARGKGREEARVLIDLDDAHSPALGADIGLHALASIDGREASGIASATVGEMASLTATLEEGTLAGSVLDPAAWRDASGILVVDSSVDVTRTWKRIEQLASVAAGAKGAARMLDKLRGAAKAEADLAPVLPLASAEGSVTAKLVVSRAAGQRPDLSLDAATTDLGVTLHPLAGATEKDAPRRISGVDARLHASFDGSSGRAEAKVDLEDKLGPLVRADALTDVPPEVAIDPTRVREVWAALPISAVVDVPRRSVQALPALARAPLEGVRGDLALSGQLSGRLGAPEFSAEAHGYTIRAVDPRYSHPVDIDVRASSDEASTLAQVYVHDAFGHLDATASLREGWRELLLSRAGLPALWEPGGTARLSDHELDVFVQAERLRARLALPFVSAVFAQLEGWIDATAHVRQARVDGRWSRTVGGWARLGSGVFQIPEVGQQFSNARAFVYADGSGGPEIVRLRRPAPGAPDAVTVTDTSHVYLDEVSADGLTGHMHAKGQAWLDGLQFALAQVDVDVEKDSPVPLTLEGVSFGDAHGELDLEATRASADEADELSRAADPETRASRPWVKLDVSIPSLHADVPESSSRKVQALADNPRIHIVGGATSAASLEPTIEKASGKLGWHVVFRLGDDVTIRRGPGMALKIKGEPVVDLVGAAKVSGQVEFPEGKIDIMGKRFEIDHGTARFDGADAGDPEVAVTARWDAPDGTRVLADYVGPLKTGKLTLRSEPARPAAEIQALLLFGSADPVFAGGAQSSQEADSGKTAAGYAGSQATAELNQVLSGVSGVQITTRVDTTVAQNPKPEVAVQISDNVTAEVAYSTGLPGPGQNPDRVLIMLDWRFRQKWSLSTTVGDKGSTVFDLLWQHRY